MICEACKIRRTPEEYPSLSQADQAKILGISPSYYNEVLKGKKGECRCPAEAVDHSDEQLAASLALEKAKTLLQAIRPDREPKDNNTDSDSALKVGKLWAVLAGKATARVTDRDEEVSEEEMEAIAKKFLRDTANQIDDEARDLLG